MIVGHLSKLLKMKTYIKSQKEVTHMYNIFEYLNYTLDIIKLVSPKRILKYNPICGPLGICMKYIYIYIHVYINKNFNTLPNI